MALHEVQEIMGHRHLTAFITNTRGGHVGRGSSWPRPETTVPGIPETTLRYRGGAPILDHFSEHVLHALARAVSA